MDFKLHGRTAFVTGASHGIGKAISLALAREGAEVVLVARTKESLESVETEIEKAGGKAYSAIADVTNRDDIERVFLDVVRSIGRLDILINNAGGAKPFGSFLDLKDVDWEHAWKLNFMSMVYCTRAAIPFLQKSDAGRIVNISSVPARQPGFFNPHYSAAKAAMLNLSRHLANILGKDNILVNSVCPSTLKGGGWDRNVQDRAVREGMSVEEAEKMMEEEEGKKTPLGRIGTPEDAANLVAFLASPLNSFITGSCISVDGGIVKSIF